MDNFMDKLSARFNAGDIIRANQEAEAREISRAKEQAEDYERMMQEMRRLHLKNVEVTEQVQQLIQSGIEQFEEYGRDAARLEELSEQGRQLTEALTIMKQELGQNYQQQLMESQKTLEGKLDAVMQQQTARIFDLEERLSKNIAQLGAETGAVSDELGRTLAQNLGQIREAIEHLKGQDASGEGVGADQIAGLKDKIDEVMAQTAGLQDHVHRENVKVYRNVQAVILDVATQRTRELSDRLDQLAQKAGPDKKAFVFAALAMLFSLASLAFQVLVYLGVL